MFEIKLEITNPGFIINKYIMSRTFQSKYEELIPEDKHEAALVDSTSSVTISEELKPQDTREKFEFISGFGEPGMGLTDY